MIQEPLDADLLLNDNESIMESLQWWEGKRLVYNLIVVGVQLYIMASMWEETKIFGMENAILGSIGHLIVANVFFSVGWGFELICQYYFGNNRFLKRWRSLLLGFGIIFSISLTIMIYKDALYQFLY